MADKMQKIKSPNIIAGSPLRSPILSMSKSSSFSNSTSSFPSATERKEAKIRSNQIDKVLKSEAALAKKDEESKKVILLGTGNSGKSTILRQVALIHGNGFTTKEMEDYKRAIFKIIRENFRLSCYRIELRRQTKGNWTHFK